jgi:16S rRNA (guanine527-N7)-methyltransferase
MSGGTQARFGQILSSALQSGISGGQITTLWHHYHLLTKWNRVVGLTSIKDFEQFVLRHYGESALASRYVSRGTVKLADVGSGAGFPGFPISVMRKEIEVALIESSQKKAAFLRECTDLVHNLKVVNSRAEDVAERYDVITARAVRLTDVLGLVGRLAPAFLLLVGTADAELILKSKLWQCDPPIPIPWSDQTVILSGHAVIA